MQYWSFLDKSTGGRRLPSLRDSKADSVTTNKNFQHTFFSIFWLHLTISYNRKQHDLKVDTPLSF